MTARELRLSRTQARALMQEAVAAAPAECCGLLLGVGGTVCRSIALTNVAATPQVEYQADPSELFRALRLADDQQMEVLAIYHSHPQGEPIPSERDIQEAHYPQAAQLIIATRGQAAEMAAWQIVQGVVRAVPLQIRESVAVSAEDEMSSRLGLQILGALITFALAMGLALAALT
ncbi:MAG: M67 family metallopeptidase [Chloroflexi bacterium]|nr:M67 family metallopeptidase [Chloroflexota bacterium]